MIIFGNLLIALAQIINLVATIYLWMIIGAAVCSWVNADPYNPIVQFIRKFTEPPISWIRYKFKLYSNGVDFSPLVMIALIYFVQFFIVSTLADYGQQIKMGTL